jgi:nucleoside triphosphate pyrophosphatase
VIDLEGRVVLASASPRRHDLLRSVGLDFEVRPADIDESVAPAEDPIAYVRRLSREKAVAVAREGELVIAADTTVEVDGLILGKPIDAADARRMLALLSGRAHVVHTGVTVRSDTTLDTIAVSTTVTFVVLDDATIDWYVGTGEPMDKAGAYAMQGAGGALVERIDGSVSNVIGLPLAETLELIGTLRSRLPIRRSTA